MIRIPLASALLLLCSSASADLLDPLAFASQGTLGSPDTPGSYSLEGGPLIASPAQLMDSNFHLVATAVLFNGVSVFDFSSINATIIINPTSTPIAILSRGDMVINPTYFPNSFGQIFPGGGGGAAGGVGGIGQPGNPLAVSGNPGGSGAADPLLGIVAGEAGVQEAAQRFGSQAGAGLELGAIGQIITSGFDVQGLGGTGATGFGTFGAGGGGGGGGVSIHGEGVTILGEINASGGNGGPAGVAGAGGGGGGGFIRIEYGAGGLEDFGGLDVNGGLGGGSTSSGSPGTNGQDGTIRIVPEPGSLVLVAVGLSVVGTRIVMRRRTDG